MCKKGDDIDFFAIVLHGSLFASVDHQRLRSIHIGDMLGFMAVSELSQATRHKFDVIADTDGILAVLPFGEIKSESRRNPLACFKALELASKKAFEVFHYNVFGHELNPAIRLPATNSQVKRLREFFSKNAVIKAFMKGFDRKDEKVFMTALRTSELEPAERLVRKGTVDRSVMIVVGGQFMAFGEAGEDNIVYKEGAVLGVESFLRGQPWPRDVICSQSGIVCKFTYEALMDTIQQAPVSAIKIVRRMVRHQCFDYIYQRKLEQKQSFEFFHLNDDDLFIDLKLNY